MKRSGEQKIPYYVDPPLMSAALTEEITEIIFGPTVTPKPCDIIFIFGGSHPGLWENGAAAYAKGLGGDIIASGGFKAGALRHHSWVDGKTPESEVIRRELIHLNVSDSHIYIETKSTNTLENVRFAMEVYDFSSVANILAVCKSYAAGRQIRTLQAQVDPDTQIIPYPFDTQLGGDGPFITRDNWVDYPAARAYLFANLLKIVHYSRAGHLVPLTGSSDELNTIIQDHLK